VVYIYPSRYLTWRDLFAWRYALNPIKIRDVVVDPPLVLAPMAGVTNHAFRVMCKRSGGAGMVCTEMFSAYAIKFRDPRTASMLDWTDEERPVSAQIFGGDPQTVAIGVKAMRDYGVDVVDVNFGCPVPKVAKSGSGAVLLKDMGLARDILAAAREAIDGALTIKTRIGWNADDITVLELAEAAQEAGIDAISVHARTAVQGYSGKADWDIIAEVVKRVDIPVIANGDVKSPTDAAKMFELTGCAGVMIGRAALGDPWIFGRTAHYLRTGELSAEPDIRQRLQGAREHAALLRLVLGEARAAKEMRGHLVFYLKGMPGAPALRNRLMTTRSVEEILEVLDEACSKC
jgi:nifR3 family TIM-barrel protein